MSLLIENADLPGGRGGLRIENGRIAALGPGLKPAAGEARMDGAGGALLPGLHDHHIHLLALAAARDSLACGPPAVRDAAQLAQALAAAAESMRPGGGGAWIRGVGYHESVAGPLDRWRLDALVEHCPVRIQHRGGALWCLNSAGLAAAGIEAGADLPEGCEVDARGRPTGRLQRLDGWLRDRLGVRDAPPLGAVGRDLARMGVTGLCDATPSNGASELALFAAAAEAGELPQHLRIMGSLDLPEPRHPRMTRGALKVMLDEDRLPPESELVDAIREAHGQDRGVAFHCVTRAELVMAAGSLERAGTGALDRIEHASLAPPDAVEWLARLGVTVVTQPNFLLERGDAYRREVETRDQPWLYRGQGFLDAGVPLGAGTDAPFGNCDPWAAMRAAVERRSAEGALMAGGEALGPEAALALFTSPLDAPGRPRGALGPGEPADLVLLDRPWPEARQALCAEAVRTTWVAGQIAWSRE